MVSNLNRSFLAALVLGLAVTGSNARAEMNVAAAEAALSQYSPYDSYDCVGNICVGMYVRVNGGEWAGHAGTVQAVDQYNDTITVLNSSGYLLYPRTYDVSAELSQPSSSGCVANICVGDQVRILTGSNYDRIGTVVDADDYNYTVTILVDGRYTIEDVRDVTLSVRPTTYPRNYPSYPRDCQYGDYVYDVYRGCVRISYPYPRPYPHPIPYPRPAPHRYPPPRGYPVPPTRYPVPRGPMPGHPYPQGPQGPGYPQGPRGPGYPQGPQAPRGPGYPQGPQAPRGPGYPQGPQAPRGPGYPQGPQAPRGPGYPQGPQAPRGSGYPQGPVGRGGQGPRH